MNGGARKSFGLIEIRPEFVSKWKEWGAALMQKMNAEARETLAEEGLSQEHLFLVELDGKPYLGYFAEGERRPANMEREINRMHKELLNSSRVRKIEGAELYSLESPKE